VHRLPYYLAYVNCYIAQVDYQVYSGSDSYQWPVVLCYFLRCSDDKVAWWCNSQSARLADMRIQVPAEHCCAVIFGALFISHISAFVTSQWCHTAWKVAKVVPARIVLSAGTEEVVPAQAPVLLLSVYLHCLIIKCIMVQRYVRETVPPCLTSFWCLLLHVSASYVNCHYGSLWASGSLCMFTLLLLLLHMQRLRWRCCANAAELQRT